MHDIEPHYKWKDEYDSVKDKESPFYGRVYSEFTFTQKVYNYFIHPQWDAFGSATLYMKILFIDYEEGFAIMEFIGEWNDCLKNDIMFLKREVVDHLAQYDITKYILICEHVLNFHSSDDCYYEEWYDDIKDERGWICLLNTLKHVEEEMSEAKLQYYVNFGEIYNDVNWRAQKPQVLYKAINALVEGAVKRLTF